MKFKSEKFIRFFILYFISFLYLFSELSFCGGDTLYSRKVAPGVTHTRYQKPGPNTLDLLEVDINNPFISLETYRPNGLTRTSIQSQQNDREGHRIIGAINGDFFSFETGWPVGTQVANGKFVLGLSSIRSQLIIDDQKRPFIERMGFSSFVRTKSGQTQTISGVNTAVSSSNLVFYTTYEGFSTGTNNGECALRFIQDMIYANDTLSAIITSKSTNGNMIIPDDGGVLSAGGGASLTFINNMNVGDTISIFLGFNNKIKKILQVITGGGRILSNGRDVSDSMAIVEQVGTDFVNARHPRTFFGFNKDTSKVFLCTVDGRLSTSIGMSFHEMASFLVSIGAWNAFNFDGGGSTTMVVRGQVTNSPSDPGGERSCANSLQVISTAPVGTLGFIDIQPKRIEIFQGGKFQFNISGTDDYYNPISIPHDLIWGVDGNIGSINSSGIFSANKVNDSGWVWAKWNNVKDSVKVIVRMIKSLNVFPSNLIMVPGERITFLVLGMDTDDNKFTLQNNELNFTSYTKYADVDLSGQVTATGFGEGAILVSLDTMKLYIPFNSSGKDTTITCESFNNLFNWVQELVNADTQEIKVSLNKDASLPKPPAVKVTYQFPQKNSILNLNCNLPLSGRPDSIAINVFGCGNADTLKFIFKDKDGDPFFVKAITTVDWKNEWRTVGLRLNAAISSIGANLDFPISLTQLQISIGNKNNIGGIIQGEILIDELQVHYSNRNVTPTVLFDFESGITGWLTPSQSNSAQLKGILISQSSLVQSSERSYEGNYSGKWTFLDDPNSNTDWDIRITRGTLSELAQMIKGSYVGAWVYANGQMNTELQIVIRDGNGQICAGPRFPVNHTGWKLIGTKLEESLFSPYLTSGKITEYGNKFNGFRVTGPNAKLNGQTKTYYIDKLVTSALTVPTGFNSFTVSWSAPLARLHWSVNSEISIDRYIIERSSNDTYIEVGSVKAAGNVDTTQQYEYVDTPPLTGTFQYRIRQMTNDGGQELSKIIEVNTGTNSVSREGSIIYKFELYQNFPNPFNPTTYITYYLPFKSIVQLKVYNILGQEVKLLVNDLQNPSEYKIEFNADNLPSGIYFYRINACASDNPSSRFIKTGKMILLR